MKYIYVVVCVFFLAMFSMQANSAEVKDGYGKKEEKQSVRQGASGDKNMSKRTTEVSFNIAVTFPHVPGPITRSKKFTFSQPVSSATLLTNNSSQYCKKIDITAADNVVYVVATFQAPWDTYAVAGGTFLVTFKSDKSKSVTFKSVDVDPDRDGKAPRKGSVSASEWTHCDGLETMGKCYTGLDCKGTLTASSTTCRNCRDSLYGKSFKSLNTGHCYPTH